MAELDLLHTFREVGKQNCEIINEFFRLIMRWIFSSKATYFLIQSIYSPSSMAFILLASIFKPVKDTSFYVLPRGDRLPKTIIDKSVRGSIKKSFYIFMFSPLLKRCAYVFSSSAEYLHYSNHIDIKAYHIIPDINIESNIIKDMAYEKVSRFLYLGRISFEKNINFIISVFINDKINSGCALELYLIGTQNKISEIRANVSKCGNIKVFDAISDREKLPQIMHGSVCVIPSLYESFGLVALEAIRNNAYFLTAPVGYWQKVDASYGKSISLETEVWISEVNKLNSSGFSVNMIDRGICLEELSTENAWKKWNLIFRKKLI